MFSPITKRMCDIYGEPTWCSSHPGCMEVWSSKVGYRIDETNPVDQHFKHNRFIRTSGINYPTANDRIIKGLEAPA